MALLGVSFGELEIMSPADEFFRTIADDITNPLDNISEEEKNETVDWEKKTVKTEMSGCLILETYKMVTVTIRVMTPNEDDAEGSYVAWTVEFEKINPHDYEVPVSIIKTLVNYLKETDVNLLL